MGVVAEFDSFLEAKGHHFLSQPGGNVESISAWVDILLTENRPQTGKPLTIGSTIIYVYHVLSYFELMMVPLDPFKLKALKKRLNKMTPPQEEADWLTEEELTSLFGLPLKDNHRLIYSILYEYARREGEVLKIPDYDGLQWFDIDFENNEITFTITKKSSKTLSSYDLTPYLKGELLEWRKKHPTDPVFKITTRAIQIAFKSACKRAGIKLSNPVVNNGRKRRLSPHILRHSRASHIRQKKQAGLDYVSKRLLVHSDVNTTIRFYRGFSEEEDEDLPKGTDLYKKR